MRLSRRQLLCLGASAAALPIFSRLAGAQVYPSRPVTIIVPVPPGGVADPIARVLADYLSAKLGEPVVVENVTGAGGSIGVGRAARATPDGYTLSIGNWLSHVGASAVYPVQYDVLEDFEPVSLLTNSPILITARKDFPANDLNELIAWLKENPGKATAATVGVGSAAHVSGVYFQRATGTRFQFVPYRGGGPAVQDELAGHVDLMFNEGTGALPYVLSRQVKPYAVLAKSRWFAAPDIPTGEELGVAGINISFWHGLWVPKGTPKEIVVKLNAAVVAALADPTVRKRLTDIGQEIFPRDKQTPDALYAFHKEETEKWWPIIKGAGIKGQ
ncbi:MAG: tripartite tricarboxylate transporter substrate binding protein BugD [Alphaproteobacteria bacterium]|nr:MAG: tripartite tricarboxylate transporter substrate binding protein BugD [Alphaproteobacteria bacterium]